MGTLGAAVLAELQRDEVQPNDLVGLVIGDDEGVGIAILGRTLWLADGIEESMALVRLVEEEVRPRWVMWAQESAVAIRRNGGRIARAWDVAAVHRLLFGGWRAEPARIWAFDRDTSR